MSLRTKLVSAFGAIALITLGVSILGYWQVKKLGSALYEIGVVRLPSIEGLEMMRRARISLEASERTLLLSSIDDTTMAAEVERQKEAWELAERGWNLYEPLPQTKEEQIKWRSFVPAWRAWKAEYEAVVSLSVESHKIGDRALLAKASEKRLTASKLAAESGALLSEITAINNQVTSDAKQQSVASYQDMILGQNVMLFSAVAGVVGALCFGLFMGRRFSRPIVQMASALSRITKGDLTARVQASSRDEIGQMAEAMNVMIEGLRTSEDRLRALSDNLPNGMVYQIVRDHEGSMHFRYVSAGIERLNGLSAEAVIRDSSLLYNQIVEEDRLIVAAAEEASLRTMSVVNVVVRLRRRDDEIRWMNLCSAPRRLADGQVLWDGIETDITERKQAEAELRRLKDYLANIIDSMPAALVGMDQAEMVTQWNRQAEALTGLPEVKAIGQPIRTLLPEFVSSLEALWEKSEKAGGPASLETVLLVRAGRREVFDLMLYPLIANGREGAVLRIENVTERSRIQELLVQTEKMMSLGGLAAGMAHEINNPLGIISQAAQNIQRRVSPELPANQRAADELGLRFDLMRAYFDRREIPVFIRDIRDAVSRAAKIVSNMLQFSRKSGTEQQLTSLEELLDRTVELAANDYDLRKHYDFRSIEIVREYQVDLPAVSVVVVEIQQVLLNLLKNAAQAMADHGSERKPRITLRLKREEKYAVLEVEDNGPGMEEKVARRVFEPFFTTKGPGVGTGLGLSVSYMIITQNHQGFFSVESSPGKGTKFAVKLPLDQRRQP